MELPPGPMRLQEINVKANKTNQYIYLHDNRRAVAVERAERKLRRRAPENKSR